MHARAERGENADAPVAQFVAAALDEDVAVARNVFGGSGLVFEVAQQVLGREVVEAVFFDEARVGDGPGRGRQFARHFTDLLAEFGGTSGAVAVPERHLARLAWGGRYEHSVVIDFFDAPRSCAEDYGVAGTALEDHFLVEFAHAGAARGADEEHTEEATIRNGSAVDDGDAARAFAGGEFVGDAIPGDAGPQVDEIVRGIPAREHVEHAFENAVGQFGEGRGIGDDAEETFFIPWVHADHGDDLLREHVERVARVADGLDAAFVHGLRDGGAGDEIAAIFGEDHGGTDATDIVIGAADTLHAARNRGRRFDLNDKIDRAHIDAEFEGRSRDDTAQGSALEAVFDIGALRGRDAAVMRAHERLLCEVVDGAGNALGEAAAVYEDDGRAVRAHQFEQLRMDGTPDGRAHRTLRGGTAGKQVEFVEARHIVDGNFDAEVEALRFAGVDDGDGAAAEKARDFFERSLRGGEADALQRASAKVFEAFQRQREVRAALSADQRVDFIDDYGVDRAEGFARV